MQIEENTEILKNLNWNDVKLRYTLQAKLSKIPRHILNRRYKKLQQLIDEDEYFNEESIQQREPILYFLYVGRYKRELDKEKESVAEMLVHQMLNNEYKQEFEKAIEECGFKEDINFNESENIKKSVLEDNIDVLIRMLHDKFVTGGDSKFFNYDEIDNDDRLDDVKTINQDNEDHYFDEEDVENIGGSGDTGIQDF